MRKTYPQRGDNHRGQYSEPQMRLFNELVKQGLPCLLEYQIIRDAEFTRDGRHKSYWIDILIGKKLPVEVDGAGHDFDGDPKRDAYFVSKGFMQPFHVENKSIKSTVNLRMVANQIKDVYEKGLIIPPEPSKWTNKSNG